MQLRSRLWPLRTALVLTTALALPAFTAAAEPEISGELKQWHRVTLTFAGPETSETATPNPFTDYRLEVVFTQGDRRLQVPGFYAADGNAAQTSARQGNKWRVHFVPDAAGKWSYRASFRTGDDVALADKQNAGKPAAFDGVSGTLEIKPSDKQGRDFRGLGFIRHGKDRYLRYAETGEIFLKGGADSPENFLAYADFDGTPDTHRYEPHVRDWKKGDPTWQEGKGKGIIGALNYLSAKGMNSIYFIPMNVGGDGKDVWPWIDPNDRKRFRVSKLDQWEIVFAHADRVGILLHMILQEQENDQLLDGGALGATRKLYFRELVARFGHHLGLVWNLGEENTNTDEQRKAFCTYLRDLDPYDHPIVCHTFPGKYEQVYEPLLGFEHFDGPSLQTNDSHRQTIKWIEASKKAGRPWFVCLDEIGPAKVGVKPDEVDPKHNEVRHKHLWGHFMAGGAGVEWYFGYQFAHNDLNLEDFRSRERMWDQTRVALEFFRGLPLASMQHADHLTAAKDDYCFAQAGELYVIYLPKGGTAELDLSQAEGTFRVSWFNPRQGGHPQSGSKQQIAGGKKVSLGEPPADQKQDWVAIVRRQ